MGRPRPGFGHCKRQLVMRVGLYLDPAGRTGVYDDVGDKFVDDDCQRNCHIGGHIDRRQRCLDAVDATMGAANFTAQIAKKGVQDSNTGRRSKSSVALRPMRSISGLKPHQVTSKTVAYLSSRQEASSRTCFKIRTALNTSTYEQ